MRVIDLIELLERFDEDAEIFFVHGSGAYTGEDLATQPDEPEHGDVLYSNYHGQYTVLTDDREQYVDDDSDVKRNVVLI